jgi:regulator of nonsense transcripts 1
LSIAIYFPRPIEKEEDIVVHDTVRLFAFPHSHKDKVGHRRVVPTKKNYRFYYDETVMQLYESHRSNSFVFFTKSANDDSAYRNVRGTGNKARARQKTIEDGINCDWRVSIALGKFSSQLATHIGRTNREPLTDAVGRRPCNLLLGLRLKRTGTVHNQQQRCSRATSPGPLA